MSAILTQQETLDNDVQLGQATRDQQREALLARLVQLRQAVEVYLKGNPLASTLPRRPNSTANPSVILKALDDAKDVWSRINAATIPGFTPPLLLRGGYAIATFGTDLENLRDTYTTLTSSENGQDINRRTRQQLYMAVRAKLIDYRMAIELNFAEGTPIRDSLPAVSPPPGSTPEPVNVSGVWDAGLKKARIVLVPSGDPKVVQYQLRTSPDHPDDAETERVVATIPVPETEFLTDDGLTTPGATARYRVYTMTATGNEAGSDTVVIERPA